MPSNASILKDANPQPAIAFPGWKNPALVNVRALITDGSGTAVVQTTEGSQGEAPTTAGWVIARQAASVYDITFPSVRRWAPSTFLATTRSAAAGSFANADFRPAVVDRSATNTCPRGITATPATGRIRVGFFTNAGAAPTGELANGLEVNVSLWVDLG